jgi:tRNA threonylcarbamoyl adenosine modification protein (Sua5/YciO/YrdC/YwlC family)
VTEEAVAAIRNGEPVILPTDTVYGLVVAPFREEPARRLSELKGRDVSQPISLMVPELHMLFELVPELRGRDEAIARALLPGPFTLVFPNPAQRFRWLTGAKPDTIGVRVPKLPEPSAQILRTVGALAATSANLAGGPEPARLADVPEELMSQAAAVIDGGELPGTASTVLDFTGPEPRVLREGAAPSAAALERALSALA